MKLESCKIALCLSGQPRYVHEGYLNIKKHILDKFNVDVFVHTWYNENDIGKQFELSPNLNYNRQCKLEPTVISDIIELYKPIKIAHEIPKSFQTYGSVDYGLCLPNSVHSMFYSICKSNELKRIYETEHDFIYDLVIRCRFDVEINSFSIEDVDDSVYYVSGEIHRSCQLNVPNDQFCISSSFNMDLYSNLYNKLDEYYINGFKLFVGEQLLKHHLIEVNNKSVVFCGSELDINIIKNR